MDSHHIGILAPVLILTYV